MIQPYELLESRWADFTGSRHAVSCSSGTSALHLALLALGVGRGDEVIVPDFAMAAVAFAVSYCGATPVYVDVDEHTYGMNPSLVEQHITHRTRAIIVVHTYGRLAAIDDIIAIAREHDIPVVEDACEAQGAVYQSKADLTCYSFYQNKIVASEEGGMVTTDSDDFAAYIRYVKSMAFNEKHDYFHADVGYNYRLANSLASIALRSLDDYPVNAQARRQVEGWYSTFLHDRRPQRDAVWFYEYPYHDLDYALTLHPGIRLPFQPISSFPMYGDSIGCPVARKLSQSLILLPVTPMLSQETVVAITEKLTHHQKSV